MFQEELADRLKLAIKERQSRKQNLDIFLAHNANNNIQYRPKSTSKIRINRNNDDLLQDGNEQPPQREENRVETNHVNVMDFHNVPTRFVPYEDANKPTSYTSLTYNRAQAYPKEPDVESLEKNPLRKSFIDV